MFEYEISLLVISHQHFLGLIVAIERAFVALMQSRFAKPLTPSRQTPCLISPGRISLFDMLLLSPQAGIVLSIASFFSEDSHEYLFPVNENALHKEYHFITSKATQTSATIKATPLMTFRFFSYAMR